MSSIARAAQVDSQMLTERLAPGEAERHLVDEAEALVKEERKNPTSPASVNERFKSLNLVLSRMLQSGFTVSESMSREEGESIKSLIRDGKLKKASQKVHDAILRLERLSRDLESDTLMLEPQKHTAAFLQTERGGIVPSTPLFRVNIHHLSTKSSFGNILKLMNPCIDSDKRRLYFTGSKSTLLGIVDLDKDELVDTFDIGIPGGFLIRDPEKDTIYLFDMNAGMFFKIDMESRRAKRVNSLPPYLSMPVKDAPKLYKGYSYINTGYPFKAGYLQDENAAYGVIEVRDSSGKSAGEIKYGPNALYFDIDGKTGKLYTTNSGDGSISVFDLNNDRKKIAEIDTGTSVDEVVLNTRTCGFYIRNRLGGSTVYYYDTEIETLETIQNENKAGPEGIGMWPAKIIYDEDKLYVLGHYGGRIDVINAMSHEIVRRIDLGLSYKARTDGISTMVMDRQRKLIYAAFPELSELAIVDAKELKHIKTVKIEGFKMHSPGPARIALAVDEKLGKLFMYMSHENILRRYDVGNYSVEKSLSVSAPRMRNIMMSNSEKGVLYLGNKMLDAETLELKDTFQRGMRVIAYDNSKDSVYLTDMLPAGRGRYVERVYKYTGLLLEREWILSPILSIPSSFAFDFKNNRFYTGYFEAGLVEAFSLTD